jgi:hypothetical protein
LALGVVMAMAFSSLLETVDPVDDEADLTGKPRPVPHWSSYILLGKGHLSVFLCFAVTLHARSVGKLAHGNEYLIG